MPDSPEPMDVKITATVGGRSKTTTVRVLPQRKWRVYVAASSHTDIGYTDVQPKCAERHCQNIDTAIDLFAPLPRLPLEPGGRLAGGELRPLAQRPAAGRLLPLCPGRKARHPGPVLQHADRPLLAGRGLPLDLVRPPLCRRARHSYRSAMISDVPSRRPRCR